MSSAWEWIKSHPWLSGGIAIGTFFLIYMLAGSSSSTSTTGSSAAGTPDESAIEASDALTVAQDQLQAQTSANNDAVKIATNANASQTTLAKIFAGMQTALGKQAQTTNLAQISAEQSANANDNSTTVSLATISAGAQTTLAKIEQAAAKENEFWAATGEIPNGFSASNIGGTIDAMGAPAPTSSAPATIAEPTFNYTAQDGGFGSASLAAATYTSASAAATDFFDALTGATQMPSG